MPDPTPNEFLAAFGIDPPAASTDPPPTDPPTDPPAPADPPPATDPPPAGDDPPPTDPPATDPPPTPPTPANPEPDKAAQAFAQMRIELSKSKKALDGVAGILGLDVTQDTDKLIESVRTKVLEAQAKKDNVPVEVLQRLDQLEQLETTFQRQQLQTQAALGFENVKKQFGLDDTKVIEFAKTLLADNINPYEQAIDLVAEYRNRNWEALIKEAEEKGRLAEVQRATKAATHGTEPGAQTGGTPGEPSKINTVADLDKFFQEKGL